jgi:hypothetical protein
MTSPTDTDVPPPSLVAMQAIADAWAQADVCAPAGLFQPPIVEVLVARVDGVDIIIEFVFDYMTWKPPGADTIDHHIYVGVARFDAREQLASSTVKLLSKHGFTRPYDRETAVRDALVGR